MKRSFKDVRVAIWFSLVLLLLAGAAWWAWYSYKSTPPHVDPQQFPVRGIDISAHNDYPNFKAVSDAGYKFVFLKASEGGDFRDQNFAINYDKARHAGLKVGAYHYFRFDRDGVRQAMNLLKVIGNRKLDLGIAVDVEEHANAKNVSLDTIRTRLQVMTEYLNMRGYRVIFYSNREGWGKYLLQDFEGFPLWICSFTDNSNRDDWDFWQFNHHGKVPGVRGDVDINVFKGSEQEWQNWLDSK